MRRPFRGRSTPHPDLEAERQIDRALADGDIDRACRLLRGPERTIQVDAAGHVVAWRGYRPVPSGDARAMVLESGEPLLTPIYSPISDLVVYWRVHGRVMTAIFERLLAAIER